MIQVGKYNKLKINNIEEFGLFLDAGTGERDDNILLPRQAIPEGSKEGDEIEVFIYRDSSNRLTATTISPKAQAGELAYLEVVATTEFGAFMDLGLKRDVFLPFKEQKTTVVIGKRYLVEIYVDKSDRLCATMAITDSLSTAGEYEANQFVTGVVYAVREEIGTFVAVDMAYKGLIPENECFENLKIGDRVEVRVIRVREDGKIDLSTRKLVADQLVVDAELIYSKLLKNDGKLNFHDKSDPVRIKKEFNLSKKAFKRALGRLLRDKKIKQTDKGIEKI